MNARPPKKPRDLVDGVLLIDKPVGIPLADQVKGAVPLLLAIVCAGYGWFAVQSGSDAGPVMVGGALIVNV